MACGIGSSLKLSPVCGSTSGTTDFLYVTSWRRPDVAGFRFSDQPGRRQIVSLRYSRRAPCTHNQETAELSSQRKTRGLTRRSVLSLGAISIQPAVVWSSNAENLNESGKTLYESLLEKLQRVFNQPNLKPKESTPPPNPVEEAVAPSTTEPEAAETASESKPESPDSDTVAQEASESVAEPVTASEADEPAKEEPASASAESEDGEGEATEILAVEDESPAEQPVSASAESGEKAQDAAFVEGETVETSAPADESPAEEPVSASAESGKESEEAASVEGDAADIYVPADESPAEEHVSAPAESGETAGVAETSAADESLEKAVSASAESGETVVEAITSVPADESPEKEPVSASPDFGEKSAEAGSGEGATAQTSAPAVENEAS